MSQTRLTDHQLNYFETFGFLSFPGLLADCIDEIIDAFEVVWEDHGGGHDGKPHDDLNRSCIVPFMDQSERLSELLDDPRIHDILASLLGDDFNYAGSDGNYYAGDTGWHSDGWRKENRSIKIALYLDKLTCDTGALRVIHGSHWPGDSYGETLQEKVQDSQELLGIEGAEVPAFVFDNQPGDVLCFYHNTKHAAFGGSPRRRMFTINCHRRYPEDRIQELRDHITIFARHWMDRVYGDAMVRTAGPDRMVHLEQIMANDGHLAELSRQMREKMSEPSRG